MAKAQNYIGGDTTQKKWKGGHGAYFLNRGTIGAEKNIYRDGGHRTYFVIGGTIGVGTCKLELSGFSA